MTHALHSQTFIHTHSTGERLRGTIPSGRADWRYSGPSLRPASCGTRVRRRTLWRGQRDDVSGVIGRTGDGFSRRIGGARDGFSWGVGGPSDSRSRLVGGPSDSRSRLVGSSCYSQRRLVSRPRNSQCWGWLVGGPRNSQRGFVSRPGYSPPRRGPISRPRHGRIGVNWCCPLKSIERPLAS